MNGRSYSLRRRMLLMLLAALVAVWAGTAWWIHTRADDEIHALLDAQLSKSARLILGAMLHEYEEHESEGLEVEEIDELRAFVHHYEQNLIYWIWDGRGQLFMRSSGAPSMHPEPHDTGFEDIVLNGKRLRSFVLTERHTGVRIQVVEPQHERDRLSHAIAFSALAGAAISLPLMGLLIWFGVGRGLAPITRIAGDLDARSADDLRPFSPDRTPSEIAPLLKGLNGLFTRISQSIENEKRFTADAAHELRTPLAGLRIQAQVARLETDPEQRDHALAGIVDGVDRTTHLVEQLLTLARMDGEAANAQGGVETAVSDIARRVIASCIGGREGESDRVSLELVGEPGFPGGSPEALEILLRNLVDNALRYGGDGPVAVRVADGREGLRIAVSDRGPGIPPDQREQVLARFNRGSAASGEGSGLGLSIVQRIVDLHGGRMTLDYTEAERGLTVTVTLPLTSH